MKRSLKFIGIAVAISIIMLSVASCSTTETSNFAGPVSGTAYNIGIPAKNFEIIGLIRVESEVDSKGNGAVITWDALLREAEARGGNGITNVMIDRKTSSSSTSGGFGGGSSSSKTTWYGSALAIRYVNSNVADGTAMSSDRVILPGNSSSSDSDGEKKKGLLGLGFLGL